MKHFKILAISICILLSSCAPYQKVIVDPQSLQTRGDYKIKFKSHFVFLGIGQTKNINAQAICEGDNLQLGSVDFVHNYWMTFWTLGIYDPRKVIVHCFSKRKS
ncbi:MAG: hypothetical protein ACI9TO_000942 [Rickettsiales bacterium]|jgi:hypothetical protein